MSVPSPNTEHVTEAKGLLTSMFRGRVVTEGLLASCVGALQRLEDEAWKVINSRNLEGSGIALDIIGKLVGEPRKARADALYRRALAVRIAINRCTGRIPEIVRIIDAVVRYSPLPYVWSYADAPPAGFNVTLLSDDTDSIDALSAALREVHANGVECSLFYGTLTPPEFAADYFTPGTVTGTLTRAKGAGTVTGPTPSAGPLHVERF